MCASLRFTYECRFRFVLFHIRRTSPIEFLFEIGKIGKNMYGCETVEGSERNGSQKIALEETGPYERVERARVFFGKSDRFRRDIETEAGELRGE
mgnify:CR=1 FL=1